MTSPSEKAILNDTLVEVSALPSTLAYRNNTGMAWQGKELDTSIGQTVVVKPGMKILLNSRPIRFGLTGSADIMGVSDGRGFAIETKDEDGIQSDQQELFETAWTKAGGLYVLVRSAREAVTFLRQKVFNQA